MIDAEQYLGLLWEQSFTADPLDLDPPVDLWVAPDIDVDQLDHLPALTWNITGDGEAADGPNADGFILNVSIFGDGMDQAKATAIHVDEVAMKWFDDPWATAATFDNHSVVVATGERIDTPTRLPAAEINGRLVVQYSGSYRLLLRWTDA